MPALRDVLQDGAATKSRRDACAPSASVRRAPNTEAVAATVGLVESGGRRQRRWVMAGDSYESSSDRRVFFGLATAKPASVEVTWPSGKRRRIVSPPAGRYLVVRE